MAISTWPTTLPKELLQDNYSQTPLQTFAKTDIDEGVLKIRLRENIGRTRFTGNMVFTKTEYSIFKQFFITTLRNGALPFLFPNPHNINNDIRVRFVIERTPFTVRFNGDTDDLRLTLNLEKLR